MTAAQRRFPYEPLARIVATRIGRPYCRGAAGCKGCADGMHAGPGQVAKWLGVSTSTTLRWVTRGGIPEASADLVCVRNNLHPAIIPGWEAWSDLDDLEHDDPWLHEPEQVALTG